MIIELTESIEICVCEANDITCVRKSILYATHYLCLCFTSDIHIWYAGQCPEYQTTDGGK